MEQNEYRSRTNLRSARKNGALTAGAAGVDMALISQALDQAPPPVGGNGGLIQLTAGNLAETMTGMEYLPITPAVFTAGLLIAGGAEARLRYRDSKRFKANQRRHADGWQTLRDLRKFTGALAARHAGKWTRPSLSPWQRMRLPLTEFGAVLGQAVTGDGVGSAGRTVVNNWERGMLVVGQPGTFKSTLMTGFCLDAPGPAVISSTKAELWDDTAVVREDRIGPARIFDPRGKAKHVPDGARFATRVVSGCREFTVANARAAAMVDTMAAGGLSDAGFWSGKAEQVLTALLMAADLGDRSLREVGTWMTKTEVDQPIKILRRHEDRPGMGPVLDTLESLTTAGSERTTASIGQTGSAILKWMPNDAAVEALDAPVGTGIDLEEFVRMNGSLYIVSDTNGALAPVVSLLAQMVVYTAEEIKIKDGQRLDPPLAWVTDEAHMTMPAVALHDIAAEKRSTGVWMCVGVQNRAQLEEIWGSEQAKTLQTSLHTTVVCGANGQDDREHYAQQAGERDETHVNVSTSAPDTLAHRLFGNWSRKNVTTSTSKTLVRVPVLRPEELGQLDAREAFVIQDKGRPSIVQFADHSARAKAMTTRVLAERAAEAARETERQNAGERVARPATAHADGGEQA